MDKYFYLKMLCQIGCITKYSWFDHSVQVIEYSDNHRHPFPWQIFGVGCFATLNELDTKLEELWQTKYKSEVEA